MSGLMGKAGPLLAMYFVQSASALIAVGLHCAALPYATVSCSLPTLRHTPSCQYTALYVLQEEEQGGTAQGHD